MTTARDVMHPGCECLGINENLTDAARWMAELNVVALPVCGQDDRLEGIITDRDIVVKCIAKGKNPAEVKAGDLIEEAHVWWIDADADIDEVLRQMAEHKIRLLLVLENKELVGIISQADLAMELLELMETVFRSFAVAVKEAVRPTGYHEHNRREVKP